MDVMLWLALLWAVRWSLSRVQAEALLDPQWLADVQHNGSICVLWSGGVSPGCEWRLSSGLCPVFPPITGLPGGRLAGRCHRLHRHKMATSGQRHVANTQQLTPRRPPLSHDMSPMCSLPPPNWLLSVSPRYLVRPWAGPRLPGRPESSSPSLVTRHSHCPLPSWRSDTSLQWWPLSAPDCRLGRPG